MGGTSTGRPLSVHDAKRRLLTLGKRQARLRSRFAAGGWGSWLRLAAAFAGGALAGKLAGRVAGQVVSTGKVGAKSEPHDAASTSRGEHARAPGLIAQIASIALPLLTREVLNAVIGAQARAASASSTRARAATATDGKATGEGSRVGAREGEW